MCPRWWSTRKDCPGVVHAVEETFACSVDSVRHIGETIKKEGLNRVVVAACTPRTHEPVFQNALREAGLNPFLFQFANIREHCSFVHMNEKAVATEKAKDLVRMAYIEGHAPSTPAPDHLPCHPGGPRYWRRCGWHDE